MYIVFDLLTSFISGQKKQSAYQEISIIYWKYTFFSFFIYRVLELYKK